MTTIDYGDGHGHVHGDGHGNGDGDVVTARRVDSDVWHEPTTRARLNGCCVCWVFSTETACTNLPQLLERCKWQTPAVWCPEGSGGRWQKPVPASVLTHSCVWACFAISASCLPDIEVRFATWTQIPAMASHSILHGCFVCEGTEVMHQPALSSAVCASANVDITTDMTAGDVPRTC